MTRTPELKLLSSLVAVIALASLGLPDCVRAALPEPTQHPGERAVIRPPPPTHGFPGFTLLSPHESLEISPGEPVLVQWTGGDASWRAINLSLIDVDIYTVTYTGVADISNDGRYLINMPASLPCNRRYQFYVEDVNITTWTYGPVFRMKCSIEVNQTIDTSKGTDVIQIINGAYPINPWINAATLQTKNIPIFDVTDYIPDGAKIIHGEPYWSSLGTWTPATLANISGRQALPLEFKLNTQTLIKPGDVIAQYILYFQVPAVGGMRTNQDVPNNCVVTKMSVSDDDKSLVPIEDTVPANSFNNCIR